MTQITHPWVVIHQPNGAGKIQTILAGPEGATVKMFSMCAADLIRHIAKAMGENEDYVLNLVTTEVNKPTSNVERVCNG